jgi:hypothetical protein
MPQLTILNHTQCEVEISINGIINRVNAGAKVIQQLTGPVQLHARAIAGLGAAQIRPGTSADGLVQNRTLILDADPNTAQLTFTVS